jgi:uncharacterized protein (TIRG00374 family)
MKHLKLLFLMLGLGLLYLVLRDTEISLVWQRIGDVGFQGFAFVLVLHFVTFLTDVLAWQLTFQTLPLQTRWLYRLYLVRMAGEAFNNVTPFASLGGEPVKALLLKSHYGIDYHDSGASLVLTRTINLIGLAVFLMIGFAFLLPSERFGASFKAVAGTGLVALCVGITLFFLIQRFQITSLAGRWLGGTRLAGRIESAYLLIREIDDRFLRFYTQHRAQFTASLAVGFINWMLGVVEIYFVMGFLGHPVSLMDAWIIEAMAQLVRAGTFFIPANIGAQEGIFVVICSAITGNPAMGLAVAMIRRAREIVWIVGGLGLWSLYSLTPLFTPKGEQLSIEDETVPLASQPD